ncbi:Phospholipase D gamma 3 [Glycine soja]
MTSALVCFQHRLCIFSSASPGVVIARTFVIRNSENPIWTQHFNVPVAHLASEVHFVVKDSDIVGSRIIGAVEHLCNGTRVEGFFPILGANGKPCKGGSVLSLSREQASVCAFVIVTNLLR